MASIGTLLSRSRRVRFKVESVLHPTVAPRVKTVPTFFGWTPGLRSLVAGRVLNCGCLIGLYETRAGALIEVLDARGPACQDRTHVCNAVGLVEDED
jgi:hypothetical protein